METSKHHISFTLPYKKLQGLALFFQRTLPTPSISPELHDLVSRYKGFIDNIEDSKKWDYAKKISNEYELINQGGNRSVSSIYPISRSYFKLLELIHDFELIPSGNDACTYVAVAEGPGGFVECFIRYRKSTFTGRSDRIHCISLKSDSNEIPNWNKARELFQQHKVSVSYGADGTGDIYKPANIQHFQGEVGGGTADLVTADGGFDYSMDFNNQEQMSVKLIFSEIITALATNRVGGHFVLKIFDIYMELTAKMLYLLGNYYDRVTVTKPFTSRPANSEKYVVAKGFRGISPEELDMLYRTLHDWNVHDGRRLYAVDIAGIDISAKFLTELHLLNVHYAIQQMRNILKTIIFIEHDLTTNDIQYLKRCQTLYALDWCKKYKNPVNTSCIYLR